MTFLCRFRLALQLWFVCCHILWGFYPCDAMLAHVLTIALCLCHKFGVLPKRLNPADFLASELLSTCVKRTSVLPKIRVFPSGTLPPNSGLWKFRHDRSAVEMWSLALAIPGIFQLSSTKMDAQSVINWTVVGLLSWQYLLAPTIDC